MSAATEEMSRILVLENTKMFILKARSLSILGISENRLFVMSLFTKILREGIQISLRRLDIFKKSLSAKSLIAFSY